MILSRKLLMRYRELKQDVPDCLLLMQVGAFMQVLGEDARAVSEVTGLTLQMAGEVEDPVVVAVQDGDKERRLAEVIRVRCGMPAGAVTAQGNPAHGPL